MDILLICRDSLANSLISNLVTAMEARKAGGDVEVLFTSEALVTVCGEAVYYWPPQLKDQFMRYTMADNAQAVGLPTRGGKGDARQIDIRGVIAMAVEAGVPMFACPPWVGLLGLKGKLPKGMAEIDMPAMIGKIKEAKQVIGVL